MDNLGEGGEATRDDTGAEGTMDAQLGANMDPDLTNDRETTFNDETSTHPKDRAIPASYGEPGGLLND